MDLAELAVKKALKLGATESEAYVNKTRTIRIEFSDQIDSVKTADLVGIGLRVFVGKRKAIYSTSILSEKEIDRAVDLAVKIARVSPEDTQWHQLNTEFGHSSASGYYDKDIEELEPTEMVEKVIEATKRIRGFDKRVKPILSYLVAATSEVTVANNYNASEKLKQTGVQFSLNAQAEEGDQRSTGNANGQKRCWKDVDVEAKADEASGLAVKFLGSKPAGTLKTSVIFRNQVFADILGIMLSGPLSAEWVQKGRSPLSKKIGNRVASENVNVTDDGLIGGGWGTRPFDDEGYPTQKTLIVDHGVLRNYLYDSYTAANENHKSTGNALRMSYATAPQPFPSNLILSPGTVDANDIIRETKKGIYVLETIGEWLSDPISGKLSATVTHGYIIENGQFTQPIKGMVFSGNFYEILTNKIETIGNDSVNSAQFYSPTVKVSELTIAGKE